MPNIEKVCGNCQQCITRPLSQENIPIIGQCYGITSYTESMSPSFYYGLTSALKERTCSIDGNGVYSNRSCNHVEDFQLRSDLTIVPDCVNFDTNRLNTALLTILGKRDIKSGYCRFLGKNVFLSNGLCDLPCDFSRLK